MFALLALLACAPIEAPQSAVNVLFLSVDTGRPDALGFFGGAADTPNLDALLGESVTLARHHSCSNWTYPSMVCAVAGRDALDMGFAIVTGDLRPIPGPQVMPTAALSGLGWRTHLITTNKFFGEHTGFARFYDGFEALGSADAEVVVQAALEAIGEGAPGERWVVHAHFFDSHIPYAPPEGYADTSDLPPIDYDLDRATEYGRVGEDWGALDGDAQALILEHMQRRYLGALSYLDDQIGALVGSLEAAGALEDTAVVLMSDHGEQFWEHGHHGHSESLHREENDSLAAIRFPGVDPRVWTGPTAHQDLWPTLFDWMGLPLLQEFTGIPVGRAPDDRAISMLRIDEDRALAGVVVGDHKLLTTWGEESALRLYDLGVDPEERDDLAGRDPERVASMLEVLSPTLEWALELAAL